MELCLIWAQDRNRAIGRANSLPWHVPEDLAHFKATTMGCPVIMGRRTWESLQGRALPGRRNIVVTHRPESVLAQQVTAVPSLSAALAAAALERPARVFVIGGAQLYAQALPVADAVYVTELDLDVQHADTFAPALPESFVLRDASEAQVSRTGVRYLLKRYGRAST